jgi:uridine monophosphate synthetase
MGLLVPVSRGISRAADPRQEAQRLRNIINQYRTVHLRPLGGDAPTFDASLADGLLAAGCVKFGQFTLKSGLVSPIYLDLRELVSDPVLLTQAAAAYLPLLQRLSFQRLAALPYAALPIGTAISIQSGWPIICAKKPTTARSGDRATQPGETVVSS